MQRARSLLRRSLISQTIFLNRLQRYEDFSNYTNIYAVFLKKRYFNNFFPLFSCSIQRKNLILHTVIAMCNPLIQGGAKVCQYPGLENTTMNDIAMQSGKGRRTLYTYFKSKEEIYYAVIEGELERLSDKLDEVAMRKIRPQDKIIELIYTHLSMIRETVVRNGNLRAEFFRNIWMVEKVRKHFDDAEIELFRKVYTEGKEDGEFDIDNIDLVADITHYCIKGLEVPYIYGRIAHGMKEEDTKPQVAKVVYGALGKFQKH